MRSEIEERMDMHAVDIYGLSEVMGPGVSQECVETKDGLHIWEDHFLPEVVDPLDATPLADGEEGELLFTSLTKQALPIIRYRTRDLTRLLPGTARPSMRRMQKITGRSDDMIILRGVNLFPTQIEEIVLRIARLRAALPAGAHDARAGWTRWPCGSRPGPTRPPARRAGGGAELVKSVKDTIGVTVACEVVDPDTLERSVGQTPTPEGPPHALTRLPTPDLRADLAQVRAQRVCTCAKRRADGWKRPGCGTAAAGSGAVRGGIVRFCDSRSEAASLASWCRPPTEVAA